MPEALLIIDVQNDFLPEGALAVPGGDGVIEPINRLLADPRFAVRIATRDWHPPDHSSFADQGGRWPPHCVADTPGAEIADAIDRERIDAIVDKGTDRDGDGYSGFENPELRELLRVEQIDAVTVVGLATDFCVARTAADALREGLRVTVDTTAARGIDEQGVTDALTELSDAGALVL